MDVKFDKLPGAPKGADAAILHEVVAVKEELERIREQVENLE